ncbi:MAG: polynucleotide 5'-kinase involved in rRNA processing, partial [Clostridium sp.]
MRIEYQIHNFKFSILVIKKWWKKKMLKVGITGGIGSGKSTVTNMLRSMGHTIIDADIVARDV